MSKKKKTPGSVLKMPTEKVRNGQAPSIRFFGWQFLLFDVGITGNTTGSIYASFCGVSLRHATGTRRALLGIEVQQGAGAVSVGYHFLFFRVGYNKRPGEKGWTRMKGKPGV